MSFVVQTEQKQIALGNVCELHFQNETSFALCEQLNNPGKFIKILMYV